jgi:S1-C subfamily serine protease
MQVLLRRGSAATSFGFAMTGACPAVVCRVQERKSAHLAGVQPGDLIVKVNQQDVSSANSDQVARIIR